MRTIICGTVAGLLLLTPAYPQPRPQGPVPVGVVTAAKQPIARSAEFVGRIEAIERVDLRARVTGYLDAVLFKEGDRVKEGDPLFRIDQAPFQASVQQAQGALLRAQGAYTNANLQAQRAEELVKTGTTAVAERDKRVADAAGRAGRRRDNRRQSAHREDKSWLHRNYLADRGHHRQDQRHQGQPGRAGQRRADDNRQPWTRCMSLSR